MSWSQLHAFLYAFPVALKVILTLLGGTVIAIACEEILFDLMAAMFDTAAGQGMPHPFGTLACAAMIPPTIVGFLLMWGSPAAGERRED